MRQSIALCVFVLAAVCVVGCGSTTDRPSTSSGTDAVVTAVTTASTSAPSSSGSKAQVGGNDIDHDSDNNNDDYGYGHPANAADMRAIALLLKRYYTAAAADDGKTACSLLYSLLAEEIPELYGEPPGPKALKGKTCAVVMAKFFKQHEKQLPSQAVSINVTTVRIKRLRGLAIMSFKSMPRRDIAVHREHKVWKVGELLDTELA
jgi:hypothetical protein